MIRALCQFIELASQGYLFVRRTATPRLSSGVNRKWQRIPVSSLMVTLAAAGGAACFVRSLPAAEAPPLKATIQIEAGKITGKVPHYLFGQFMEHEHNTIDNGLLAELLQNRKFDRPDEDGNGVSAGWVPEERIQNRYWELRSGQGVHDRYAVDREVYYGGGVSQQIQLYGSGSNRASVYQIGLQLAKGRRYALYVYMRKLGTGKGFVEVDSLGGPVYLHQDFDLPDGRWDKYSAEFTAPEDTRVARMRIGFEGAGTFWIDSASLMPSDNVDGMRRDVIEALRPIHISVLRYPGGCYADYYDWKKGIGPRDKRPEVWSTVWHEWNSNDFGTDEYMELARMLGYDGHITTNYSSGTAEDAAEWVEYANGSPNTPMGRLRAENGHSEPYGIKLWALGNEAPNLCNEEYTGGTKIEQYADRFHEYEQAMHKVDPSVELMASSVGEPKWIASLLQAVPTQRLAISIYTGRYTQAIDTISDQDDFYKSVVAEPLQFESKLEANMQAAGSRLPQHPFFAITEFNSWWIPEIKDPDYRVANALYFGGVFNQLLRQSGRIFLAENCSLINVQGMIEVNPVAIKLPPPYFTYVLYSNHIGTEVLKTDTTASPVPFNAKLPALDAVATRASDGRTIYLAVVNRAQNQAVSAKIDLGGAQMTGHQVQIYELNGKSWDAFNPYGSTDNVSIAHRSVDVDRAPFSYVFPAHSVTLLEIGSQQEHSGDATK
jgi:alpha-N-arabinofuranosidase